MPAAIKANGKPAPDPAVLCHPDIVRDHTARLAAMEKQLATLVQGQRELIEGDKAISAQLERRNTALDRLLSRLSLGDAGLTVKGDE